MKKKVSVILIATLVLLFIPEILPFTLVATELKDSSTHNSSSKRKFSVSHDDKGLIIGGPLRLSELRYNFNWQVQNGSSQEHRHLSKSHLEKSKTGVAVDVEIRRNTKVSAGRFIPMAKVFGYVSDVRYKWTLRLNSTLNKLEGVGTMRFEGKGSAFGFSSARKVNEKVGQRVDEQVKAQIINAIKPAVEDFEAAYNAPAED